MLRSISLSLAILVCQPSSAMALTAITVGDYFMPAGTAGNQISVFVTGGDAVPELNFIMDSNNNVAGGPIITAVDIVGPGTIFFGNNTGQLGVPAPPATKIKQTTTTVSGTVLANGLLGHVTFSTVGISPGKYNLRMANMAAASGGSATNFSSSFPNVINGSITVVPEPSALILPVVGFIGLAAWRWRR